MAVTATTVAAATTMLAAVAAVFLTFMLCFYIFLCAKRYRGGGGPPPPPPAGRGVAAWLRYMFSGGGGGAGVADGGADAWCYEGGLDEKSMAKLPSREVGKGEALDDCAVCITELKAGDTARVLPRCGHGFHVDCVDMWLRSHSTCPLCRCPAVDEPPVPPAVPTPEADPESPNFPTNVLFFGSQDEVSTGRSHHQSPAVAAPPPPQEEHVAVDVDEAAARPCGLRRLIGCGGASPPPQQPHHHHHHHEDVDGDIEMGLAAGESSASRPVKPTQPGS
ncbi:unnamed protein product [Urochloa decumbens]|uniref:RING-type domain-containing protein n=1 Tax=Urochloa decumbens TaxID=240449 RepID=A0ABC9FA86_9POAL